MSDFFETQNIILWKETHASLIPSPHSQLHPFDLQDFSGSVFVDALCEVHITFRGFPCRSSKFLIEKVR